jgi:glycosyltransferase involved in cell wall biosynthesis
MRILHLDAGREMRGGQWQALRLIEGLAGAGHESLLLAREGSPLFAAARGRGIDTRALNVLSLKQASRDAAIVHAHDSRCHTLAALVGIERLVVARRVAFPVQRGLASTWKYQRAAHYIAVSNFVKRMLSSAGVPEPKITVVYDGVELRPVAHGPEIIAPDTDDPRKGTALALDAAKIAGIPLKRSRDLESDLARAGLFVYITHEEGLGSAVLLAMAAGVPVIASDVGGLPEIVDHERTGLLTENTPEAIGAAITRMMHDRPFAACLAERARAAVAEKFSVKRMAAATIEVYRAIAG